MNVDIQFVSSAVKVLPDSHCCNDLKKLYFYGVKNEYESCQIIVKSNVDIKKINLISTCITNDLGTIPMQSFETYYENYAELKNGCPDSIAFPAGLYPDALVEQSICVNPVNSPNGFHSLWVTLKIPSDCSAGIFTGKFQLIFNDMSFDIPVEVEIADYILSDKSTMKTSFGIFADYLDPKYPVDDELLEICFEEHFKYRINPFLHFRNYPESKRIVALIDKFFDYPQFTGFGLPDYFGSGGIKPRIDVLKETILLLAQKSTKNRNLLSKIYVYYFDEPEGNNIVENVEKSFDYFNAMLIDVIDEINNDKIGLYSEFKKIENYSDYILKIENLGTILLDTYSGIIQEKTDIFCPSFANFTDNRFVEQAKCICNNQQHQLWWYGCQGPHYPFPTYHIADRLLTSRIVSWMQYRYDIVGNLYWRSYGVWENEVDKIDNYKGETDVSIKPFGDGFLFYYGSICNQKRPLPSIRLMSIRDGIEEYELLKDLERKYEEYKKVFDYSFDSKIAVKTICDKMFDNVYTNNDLNLFDCVRREVIEKLSSKHKIPYAVGSIKINSNKGIVTFYTLKDACIFIDDNKLVSLRDGVYTYAFDLKNSALKIKVRVEHNGICEEHIELISNYIDYLDTISCNDCRNAFTIENAKSKLNVCYSPVRNIITSKGVSIELKYSTDNHPEIYFDINSVDKNLLRNANKVSFSVYNMESRSLTIFERLCGEGREIVIEANELFPNRENVLNVEIELLKEKIDFNFEKIKLVLRNTYPEDDKKDMKIIIDNVKIYYNI